MNCQEFDAIVVDLVRGEGVGSEAGTLCWAHAANCPHCAERLLQQEKLAAGFAALSIQTEQTAPQTQFEDVLRREFRKEFANPEGRRDGKMLAFPAPSRAEGFKPLWSWAAVAAALLLASVIGLLELRSGAPQGSIPTAQNKVSTQPGKAGQSKAPERGTTQTTSTGQTKSGQVSATSATEKGRTERKKNSARPNHPASRLNPDDEVATNFYPLPYGSGLSLDEGWQIVRVSLRPAALASLGLEMPNQQMPSGNIKADLVLGEDGMARAIRFVE